MKVQLVKFMKIENVYALISIYKIFMRDMFTQGDGQGFLRGMFMQVGGHDAYC